DSYCFECLDRFTEGHPDHARHVHKWCVQEQLYESVRFDHLVSLSFLCEHLPLAEAGYVADNLVVRPHPDKRLLGKRGCVIKGEAGEIRERDFDEFDRELQCRSRTYP